RRGPVERVDPFVEGPGVLRGGGGLRDLRQSLDLGPELADLRFDGPIPFPIGRLQTPDLGALIGESVEFSPGPPGAVEVSLAGLAEGRIQWGDETLGEP